MKVIPIALLDHYASGTTTLATCWLATLTDGTVVASTSHDVDLVIDGVTYLSSASYSASTIESASELNPDNLEIEGFLASPHITDEDIYTGRWDYAAVEIFEVNFTDLAMGRNILRSGTLGEVRAGRARFTAELRGMMQAFSRRIVRIATQDCTSDLGDSRCTINLASWTVAGAVTAVASSGQFTDTSRTEANDYFTGGKITFTSGLNDGLSMEVKKSQLTGTVILVQPMPFAITVGDTYSMHAGCSKRFVQDCKNKFNNAVNFRGFPHLPGSSIYATGMN